MQNPTDAKTKIDSKLATEAALAPTTTESSAVAEPTTVLLSKKELKIPEDWELLCGDLDKLEPEDSKEWVVYQNKAYKVPTAKNATAADPKNDKEVAETDLLSHIFIYRSEEKVYQPGSGRFRATGERPITLFLLYKDTQEANKFSELRAQIYSFTPLGLYCILGKEIQIQDQWRTTKATEHLEKLIMSEENAGVQFRVSVMREQIAEQLFDLLVEKKNLSRIVADYFKQILGHKPIPKTEQQKRNLIQEALNKNARADVLRIAREIHVEAIEENRKHNRLLDTVERNGVETHHYLDDATVAYQVGEGWSTTFPQDAYEAFKILTESSPLYEKARAKMTIMSHELSVRATLIEGEDSVTGRFHREKAMMSALEAAGDDDQKRSRESVILFLKLLEVHAGYNAIGNGNRLLKVLIITNRSV